MAVSGAASRRPPSALCRGLPAAAPKAGFCDFVCWAGADWGISAGLSRTNKTRFILEGGGGGGGGGRRPILCASLGMVPTVCKMHVKNFEQV